MLSEFSAVTISCGVRSIARGYQCSLGTRHHRAAARHASASPRDLVMTEMPTAPSRIKTDTVHIVRLSRVDRKASFKWPHLSSAPISLLDADRLVC